MTERQLTPDDEFFVMACDGIWDCFSNQQVVNFVREGIARGDNLDHICENLMDHCLAPKSNLSGIGCDNMTLLVIGLPLGESKEAWRAKCSRPSSLNTPENQ